MGHTQTYEGTFAEITRRYGKELEQKRVKVTRPALPDRPVQGEHESRRDGALNLLAAFDTRSGKVWGELAPRKRQGEFLAL